MRRFLKSGISGGLGSTFDFGAMLLLVEGFAWAYAPAAAAAALAGALACFVFTRFWAFRDRQAPLGWRQLGGFAMLTAGSAVLNAGVVHVLAGMWTVPYFLAKVVSAGVVFASWSYPVQDRWVFAAARDKASSAA